MGTIAKLNLRRKKTILRKDCSEVMLWQYLQMINSNDYSYLVKSGKKPSNEVLISKLEEINKEFADLRGEQNMVNKFDLISYREELELKCKFGIALIDRIQTRIGLNIVAIGVFEGLISELESWGFEVNKEIPLIDALLLIKSEIEAFQTTIETLTEEIYPTRENEAENEETASNQMLSFESMLLIYQRILKIDKINPKKTSLVRFVAMEKQVKEIIKNNQSNKSE